MHLLIKRNPVSHFHEAFHSKLIYLHVQQSENLERVSTLRVFRLYNQFKCRHTKCISEPKRCNFLFYFDKFLYMFRLGILFIVRLYFDCMCSFLCRSCSHADWLLWPGRQLVYSSCQTRWESNSCDVTCVHITYIYIAVLTYGSLCVLNARREQDIALCTRDLLNRTLHYAHVTC